MARVCHVTWHARDIQRTRLFLAGLFGWTFDASDPAYLVALSRGMPGTPPGLNALETAMGERAVISDWQPISTAPRDGTIILIFERRVGTAGLVRVSRWRDDTIPSGWTGAENPPSHWLPLPLPPKRLSFVAADPSWVPGREFEAPVAKDATGQSLAGDARETAQVPTMDEAP